MNTDATTQSQDPEIDTTKIVNICDTKFTFHIGGKPVELEPGESKVKPIYVAQVGAKHMVDFILQAKHGVKNTLADSDLRRSLFAQILPEMADERGIVPMSAEEEKDAVRTELKRQAELIRTLQQRADEKPEADKDAQIAALTARLEALEGRPAPKVPARKKAPAAAPASDAEPKVE